MQRYSYTQRHRNLPANGALTDAEWELARDLFEPQAGARGRPALHDRRAMVDACCYVLRTRASWRSLPAGSTRPGSRCKRPLCCGPAMAASSSCSNACVSTVVVTSAAVPDREAAAEVVMQACARTHVELDHDVVG